jgi:hypothetical protein
MDQPLTILFLTFIFLYIAAVAALIFAAKSDSKKFKIREDFLRDYKIDGALLEELDKEYPGLTKEDRVIICQALLQFFLIRLKSKNKTIAMPSKVVDTLWHNFILDTRSYHDFCWSAFGGYFHHTPAAKMTPGISSVDAMRTTWRLSWLEEFGFIPNLSTGNPSITSGISRHEAILTSWRIARLEKFGALPNYNNCLPLLFSIDEMLNIHDGNVYSPTPFNNTDQNSCSSGSGCGGFVCSGDGLAGGAGDGGSSCSGGDGGGCGGGGGD